MREWGKDPIDEELREHFEALRHERLAAGDTEEQATRFARHRLGHVVAIGEEVRGLSWFHRADAIWRHGRFALRSFHRHGGAYLLATAILSIGIALSVAVFSLVDAVVLAPLPIPEQDRVHLLWKTDPLNSPRLVGEMAYPELADLQATMPEWEHVALFPAAPYGNGRVLQTGTGDPIQIESCPATPAFFKALGVAPAMGRDFEPGDTAPVVVLSDRVWREQFGGRADVVNTQVRLNGRGHTVIGVMPPAFDFPRGVGLWVNLPASIKRSMIWLQAVGRARPGVSRQQLQASADRTFRMQVTDHPDEYVNSQRSVVTPIAEFLTGSSKTQLLLSLGASILLLLSACVSAGNLFLSRALARRQEVATRASLGATPGQILAQFATEAMLAAGMAATAGGVLAAGLIRLLVRWAPAEIPRIETAGLNLGALLFAAGVALLAALACGVGPALLVRGKHLDALMRDGGTRTAGSCTGRRLQRAFVFLQAAFTVVILVAGTMLFASYRAMLRTDIGLGHRDALTINLALRGPRVTPESFRAFYLELIERLRATPEITHAAGVLLRPLEGTIGWDTEYTMEFENGTRDPDRVRKANFEAVTTGYFAAIGTPLLEGRDFNEHDTMESEKVVIISRSLAEHFRAAGLEPLGQRMRTFGETRKIVGVTADARYRGVVRAGEDVYVPNRQVNVPTNYLVVRGRVPAGQLLRVVRQTVKHMDPEQAMAGEATLGELVEKNTARERFNVAILLLFAIGAVVLAAAGILSVVRESITVRAKEIAIRIALGAGQGRLAAQTVQGVLVCVAAGTAAGLAGAYLAGPATEELLYMVAPRDPALLLGAGVFVMLLAVVAALAPAWQAAGGEPRERLLSD
ncbi:MAG: ABC transporter permease [Bryobacterales bacterium]|nr:ABC transporter permease [Bryobacterales bacterium]